MKRRKNYARKSRRLEDFDEHYFKNQWGSEFCVLLGIIIALLIICLGAGCAEACSRDISQLKPETRKVFNELSSRAAAEGISFKVICTYRTQEEQIKLYAKGRSLPGKKVTWTKRSRHSARTAFDIVVVKERGLSWKPEDYFVLGRIGRSLGLTWGGDWKVRDYGHFELK